MMMSMTSRYECPVDGCPWHHEPAAPQLDIPDGPAVGTVYRVTVENTEAVLAAHFRGHRTEDYLRTIVRLREIATAAEALHGALALDPAGISEKSAAALARLTDALYP